MDNNVDNIARIEAAIFTVKRLMFQHNNAAMRRGHHILPAPLLLLLKVLVEHDKQNAEPITTSELAKELHISLSMTTQMINTLEDKNVVRRIKNAADRRITHVVLSRKGRAILQRMRRHGHHHGFDVLNDLLDFLGPKDSTELARLIERIGDFFQQESESKP
jgi:DNA-binding MarR family transcriptional regulator